MFLLVDKKLKIQLKSNYNVLPRIRMIFVHLKHFRNLITNFAPLLSELSEDFQLWS